MSAPLSHTVNTTSKTLCVKLEKRKSTLSTHDEAVNIHFDDFTVKHSKTNVVQAVDYYPFGAVASSYTRTAADPTKYLYNAGAELNDLTGYYETFFRNYDATIGRFNGVDIAVGKYKSQTPYNYAFNDPVALNDPMGDDVYGCTVCNPDNSTFVERFNEGGISAAWGTGGSFSNFNLSLWTYQNALVSRIKADEQNRRDAIAAYVGAFSYMEVFMSYVRGNGDVLDMGGDFHVYTDQAIMAGVVDYYLHGLRNLQSFYANGNQHTWESLRGGVSLVKPGGKGLIEAPRGTPSGEVDMYGMDQLSRGTNPSGGFWKSIGKGIGKFLGLTTSKPPVVTTESEIKEVQAKIDSFVSTEPSFFLGNGTLNQNYQGYAIDGIDTSRFIMYPDSSFFDYDTYYKESLPTKVVKIN